MAEENQEKIVRATLFVDGFNLYHPIHEMRADHLKWLNLWSLGELICSDRGHQLTGAIYCTAYPRNHPEKYRRHRQYVTALESAGVNILFGHYMTEPSRICSNCQHEETKETEKQTDINVALSVFSEAIKNTFDAAYILSADSDQAATAKFMKTHFPEKQIVTVSPPNRPVSDNILNVVHGKRRLNRGDIEKCLFPPIILPKQGNPIRCPVEYEPPK